MRSARSADSSATLSRIKASMHALGGRFRDMDTIANLVITPPKNSGDAQRNQRLTMAARLFVKMPDKVKFQVLSSSFPLFNRWVFVQRGDDFAAYDPVSDRQVQTDFRRLTGREPARVDTSMALLGLLFDPSRYKFQLLGATKHLGKPVYRVRMTFLKPQQIKFYTLTYTDLYMDTRTLTPVYSESFDRYGRLATSSVFSNVKKTPAGLAPTRIRITDHAFERFHNKHLEERARRKLARKLGRPLPEKPGQSIFMDDPDNSGAYRNGTMDLWIGWNRNILYPWKMLATAPNGATSTWTFSETKINTGLPDKLFKL